MCRWPRTFCLAPTLRRNVPLALRNISKSNRQMALKWSEHIERGTRGRRSLSISSFHKLCRKDIWLWENMIFIGQLQVMQCERNSKSSGHFYIPFHTITSWCGIHMATGVRLSVDSFVSNVDNNNSQCYLFTLLSFVLAENTQFKWIENTSYFHLNSF